MGSKEIWKLELQEGWAFIGAIGSDKCIEKRASTIKEEV